MSRILPLTLCILLLGSVTAANAQAILKLPDAVVDETYNQNIADVVRKEWKKEVATDSQIEWRSLPGFPAGLDIDSAGNIYGTPQFATPRLTFGIQLVDQKSGNQLLVLKVALRILKESPSAVSPTPGAILRPIGSSPPKKPAKPEKPKEEEGKDAESKGAEGEDEEDEDEEETGTPGIELKHDGVVSTDATTTKVTVHVTDPKLKKVLMTVKSTKDDSGLSTYLIKMKTGVQDYVQQITLVDGINSVSARDGVNEKAKPVLLTIKRKDNSEKIKVSASRLVDRSALSAPVTVSVFDPAIGKVKLLVLAKDQEKEGKPVIFDQAVIECGTAAKDGCPIEVRLPEEKDGSVYLVDVTSIEDPTTVDYAFWKAENDKAAAVADKRATAAFAFLRRGDAAVALFAFNSLNTRAILGFEQAGASSAASTSKPFVDFFFTAPIRSRAGLWGDIRLAVIPQQASAFGVFPTTLANQITENKLSNLAQGFDFILGPEFRLGTGNLTWSLIPGVKQKISVYAFGAFGAISPFDPKQQENVQIFTVPATNSPQYEEFKNRFPEAATSGKPYVAFTFPERDRFLRQFYAGLRFKTHFFNSHGIINRFPAIFDVALGRNEAVTGGKLKDAVLRLEGFYPLPIKETSFIYLYGTAMMKFGGGGVNIQKPLFLDTPGSTVGLSSPDLFIVPNRQNNSDYFRLGIGIDLMRLFNSGKKEK